MSCDYVTEMLRDLLVGKQRGWGGDYMYATVIHFSVTGALKMVTRTMNYVRTLNKIFPLKLILIYILVPLWNMPIPNSQVFSISLLREERSWE